MSDDEARVGYGGAGDEDNAVPSTQHSAEHKTDNGGNSSSSDDDNNDDGDSSSSSSDSSSSSSDSDSDSDNEDQENADATLKSPSMVGAGGAAGSHGMSADRKYSIDSLSGSTASNGLSHRSDVAKEKAHAEPLNVNSTRAAARFREQAGAETGLMALGTKKRDRRTIEEIQRDLQKKRGRSSGPSSSLTSAGVKKPMGASVPVARASPPKTSPVMSPDSGTEMEKISLGVPMGSLGALKGKANSARARLEKKLLGRGGGRPATTTPAKAKKPTATSASSSTPQTSGMVTNISAGVESTATESRGDYYNTGRMEPKIEPKIIDAKPDGRIIRSVLRSMLRYGDLTDVNLFRGDHHKSFADELSCPTL
ncbi:hypothetical protein PINS_up000223 [Pythium insidiosum]|nr:hypothetical protein PINS_up000223 [Pythium insidiosum]